MKENVYSLQPLFASFALVCLSLLEVWQLTVKDLSPGRQNA